MRNSRLIVFLFLGCIVLFGFAIRAYHLQDDPPGFFADEASIGYNAYTIAANGTDEAGNVYPILFQNFGTFFRPGVSVYATIPLTILLGLNEVSGRLTAAFIGTATIFVLYFLVLALFSSRIAGLLSALLLATSPWHIHFSRVNQEFIYFVFFFTTSLCVFLKSIKSKNPYGLILSFVLFGITLYTYVPAYFLVPLFLLCCCIIYRNGLWEMRNGLAIAVSLFFLLTVPLLEGLQTGKTLSRFTQLSLANQEKTPKQLMNGFVTTYINHFSLDFLFFKGDIGYPTHFITRFSVRGGGELYLFQLPLIFLGLWYCFLKKRSVFLLMLSLLLLYPLGSSAAPFADGGGPFAMRSILGVLPFTVLSSIGGFFLLSFGTKRIRLFLLLVFLVILSLNTEQFLHRYFIEYPTYAADFWGWQYGARDVIHYFVETKKSYDALYLSPSFNAPDIFLKFYSPTDCNTCRIGLPDQNFDKTQKQLFAVPPSYLAQYPLLHFKKRKTVDYPDGTVAFEIGEVLQ